MNSGGAFHPAVIEVLEGLLQGDERFVVTGASGWFGRVTLDLLAALFGPKKFGERVTGFASRARVCDVAGVGPVHLQPTSLLPQLAPRPTHLVHFGYLTKERVAELGVAEYVRASVELTATVVGVVEAWRPRALVFASSGAALRDGRPVADLEGEPYGTMKHLDELALRQGCRDVGATSVVTRVFAAAGPHMTKPERYALGDLVRQALDGGPLTVRARHHVVRSYASVADIVAVALAEALARPQGRDVVFESGGEVLDLRDLAQLIVGIVQPDDARVVADVDDSLPPDRYVSEAGGLEGLAARHGLPITPLDEQIRALVESWRSALAADHS